MARPQTELEPTDRQTECFETYARFGDAALAAAHLGISVGRLKNNVSRYCQRVGANSSIQAAYLRWAPREDSDAA